MKYIVLSFFLVTLFYNTSFADSMIVYKYADGDKYSFFVGSASGNISISAIDLIAKKKGNVTFSLKNISEEYYNVTTIPNIIYFGDKITQYTITPKTNDRFTQIVWVDKENNLIKSEVFDDKNKLMSAFNNINTDSNKGKKGEYIDDLRNIKPFFKGFSHISSKIMPGNINHLIFSDGVNKFSLFINNHVENTGSVTKIVYGNYLLSRIISGVEYTVVGSIPYSTMSSFIEVVSKNVVKINQLIKSGSQISEEIYKVSDKTEE